MPTVRRSTSATIYQEFDDWGKSPFHLSVNPVPNARAAHAMTTQNALWLPNVGLEFAVGRNAIPEPGPGEVLVKLGASALNQIDVRIQKSGFFTIKEYPAIIGEDGAGVVQKVGVGVTNLVQGDKVFVRSLLVFETRSVLVLGMNTRSGSFRRLLGTSTLRFKSTV